MPRRTSTFETRMPAHDAIDAFETLCVEQRWRVVQRRDAVVTARRRLNWLTWGEDITVGAAPAGDVTRVELEVRSWQLVDWGSGRRIEEAIRDRLGAAS